MSLKTNQFNISNFSIFISPQSLMKATFLTNGASPLNVPEHSHAKPGKAR